MLPDNNRAVTVTLNALPDGVSGVKETLKLMVTLVRQGKTSLAVRRAAQDAIATVPQKAYLKEARAIQQYVRDLVRYTRDVNGIETLHTPDMTLAYMQGDCDDKAVLVASMLEAVGHPTRIVAVGPNPSNFVHVLVETKIGSDWVPVETTENVPLGWYPSGYPARLVYNV